MASDASHMLEAALEQMDDIIAGKTLILLQDTIWNPPDELVQGSHSSLCL